VVERDDSTGVATFFAPEIPAAGGICTLGDDAAHHMRVRRIAPPERVRLCDGAGTIAGGSLVRLTKTQAAVEVDRVETVLPAHPVHLLVPIADRERMLWLAEKSVELGATTWRPVLWRRSRSVSPRGEGNTFQGKVRARMVAALEQSGSAWLPAIYPDAPLDLAVAATPAGTRWLLDPEGDSLRSVAAQAPISVAIGPEGGLAPDEREQLVAAGFIPVAVAANILRFETAGVVGLAFARAAVSLHSPSPATQVSVRRSR
jgi:16S rRNA (uracil1498-N3)-methyltransferase